MSHEPVISRVTISASPSFNAFYYYFPIVITCGFCATLIQYDFAKCLDKPIHPTTQLASQADGLTKLTVEKSISASILNLQGVTSSSH